MILLEENMKPKPLASQLRMNQPSRVSLLVAYERSIMKVLAFNSLVI